MFRRKLSPATLDFSKVIIYTNDGGKKRNNLLQIRAARCVLYTAVYISMVGAQIVPTLIYRSIIGYNDLWSSSLCSRGRWVSITSENNNIIIPAQRLKTNVISYNTRI